MAFWMVGRSWALEPLPALFSARRKSRGLRFRDLLSGPEAGKAFPSLVLAATNDRESFLLACEADRNPATASPSVSLRYREQIEMPNIRAERKKCSRILCPHPHPASRDLIKPCLRRRNGSPDAA